MNLRTWTDDPTTNPVCPYCDRLDVACVCPDEAACIRCSGQGWVHGCADDFCRGNDRDCCHPMSCPDCEGDWLP